MKTKILISLFFLAFALVPRAALAAPSLSELCFPAVTCGTGQDYYADDCRPRIQNILTDCGAGKGFNCDNGCYTLGAPAASGPAAQCTQHVADIGTSALCCATGEVAVWDATNKWVCGKGDSLWVASGNDISNTNTGAVSVGTASPQGKLTVKSAGGFGGENPDGTSLAGNIPIVAQMTSDSTFFGAINMNSRQAFAMNIENGGGTNVTRGTPVFYDKFDGTWHSSAYLKNGNLGLGAVPSSYYKLDVTGNANINGTLSLNSSDVSQYFINSPGTSGQVWKSDGVGSGVWGTDNIGTPGPWLQTGGEIYLPTIAAPGYFVGIGTTNPGSFSAHFGIESGTNPSNYLGIRLQSNDYGYGNGINFANYTATTGRNYTIYSGSDGAFHFKDGITNTDRIYIKSDGNVGIGTSNPIRTLQVNGELSITRSDKVAYINVSDAAGNGGGSMIFRGLTTGGTAQADAAISFVGTTNTTGAASVGGELKVSGTSPQVKFDDTDNHDYWIHNNSNQLYFLYASVKGSGWDTYPLVLNGADVSVGGNLHAPNNTWDSSVGTVWIGKDNGTTANCPDGQYMCGATVTGWVDKIAFTCCTL